MPLPRHARTALASELPASAPLPRSFYLGDPMAIAPALLGKLVVRQYLGQTLAGRIVETEAYLGTADLAAHASAGRTDRNQVLFGPPGHAYVYFIYGIHNCLNVSCEPEGSAGCVLIRALEPVVGHAAMSALRGLPPDAPATQLASGPGKLCQALAITRLAHNGVDLTDPSAELFLAVDNFPAPQVVVTPRIGIRRTADLLARFYIADNPSVSRRS